MNENGLVERYGFKQFARYKTWEGGRCKLLMSSARSADA